jgi:hypothetical protein
VALSGWLPPVHVSAPQYRHCTAQRRPARGEPTRVRAISWGPCHGAFRSASHLRTRPHAFTTLPRCWLRLRVSSRSGGHIDEQT